MNARRPILRDTKQSRRRDYVRIIINVERLSLAARRRRMCEKVSECGCARISKPSPPQVICYTMLWEQFERRDIETSAKICENIYMFICETDRDNYYVVLGGVLLCGCCCCQYRESGSTDMHSS